MYNTHCDEIKEGDNVIIGLGDSFTQGVGAYSLETWKSIPDRPNMYNISGQHFLEEQGQHNWVRQLCRNHLSNYKVFNLGVNGAGNRAAVKELYLNPLPDNLGNVIVILMSTGIERFDMLKQTDDTAGVNWHQKWQTIFPGMTDRGPISEVDRAYFKHIYSARSDALEFLFNVRDAQNFCKSKGYKFLFASAFDDMISKKQLTLKLGDKANLIDIADWTDFIAVPGRRSIMDFIHQLEFKTHKPMCDMYRIFGKQLMPTKYITPCCHWTTEAHGIVSKYLYTTIKTRNLL